jgi:hypothetical protein
VLERPQGPGVRFDFSRFARQNLLSTLGAMRSKRMPEANLKRKNAHATNYRTVTPIAVQNRRSIDISRHAGWSAMRLALVVALTVRFPFRCETLKELVDRGGLARCQGFGHGSTAFLVSRRPLLCRSLAGLSLRVPPCRWRVCGQVSLTSRSPDPSPASSQTIAPSWPRPWDHRSRRRGQSLSCISRRAG